MEGKQEPESPAPDSSVVTTSLQSRAKKIAQVDLAGNIIALTGLTCWVTIASVNNTLFEYLLAWPLVAMILVAINLLSAIGLLLSTLNNLVGTDTNMVIA